MTLALNSVSKTPVKHRLIAKVATYCALVALVALASCQSMSGSENMEMTNSANQGPKQEKFNFNDPVTFHFGNDAQIAKLRSIAEEEFSLDHLSKEDQELLNEALQYSGVEVHKSCVIERSTNGKIRAFLGRWNPEEHMTYHPSLGSKGISHDEKPKDDELPDWKTIVGDYVEYPYPFSEEMVIPKAIPVNMSTIRLVSRDEFEVHFTARPSSLLMAKLEETDRIVTEKDLAIDFVIDKMSKRISRQAMYLEHPVRVQRGISISELNVDYEFAIDPISNRHVMTTMSHTLRGNIWWVVRPSLAVDTDLNYLECLEEPNDRSYLYASMDAIQALN